MPLSFNEVLRLIASFAELWLLAVVDPKRKTQIQAIWTVRQFQPPVKGNVAFQPADGCSLRVCRCLKNLAPAVERHSHFFLLAGSLLKHVNPTRHGQPPTSQSGFYRFVVFCQGHWFATNLQHLRPCPGPFRGRSGAVSGPSNAFDCPGSTARTSRISYGCASRRALKTAI